VPSTDYCRRSQLQSSATATVKWQDREHQCRVYIENGKVMHV
jgi:hypothetical protein